MAAIGSNWVKALSLAVLLIGAWTADLAQSTPGAEVGSLAGRLTDLYSHPLSGVKVILRNEKTGSESSTITAKDGAYLFTHLEPGEYTLEADSPHLGRGEVGAIVVAGGHQARVQTALNLEAAPSAPVQAKLQEVGTTKTGEQPGPLRAAIKPTAPPLNRAAGKAMEPQKSPAPKQTVEEGKAVSSVPAPALNNAAMAHSLKSSDTSSQKQDTPKSARASTGSAPDTPASAARISINPGQAPLAQAKPASLTRPEAVKAAIPSAAKVSSLSQAAPDGPQVALVAIANHAMLEAATQIALVPYKPVMAASEEKAPAAHPQTTSISTAELQALPVSGRHWEDFVLDNTPTSATPSGGQGEISLRGTGQQRAASEVDGVERGLVFGSTSSSGQNSEGHGSMGQGGEGPAGMGQVGIGGHGLAMSEAAIRAVETVAGNVEAEVARAAGGRINVETQRGGDNLHGQGFLFDRQNAWGAKNPFSQWVKEIAPASATYNSVPSFAAQSYTAANNPSYTPPDHEITWGAGAGGRIRRDKLYWFAAVDGNTRNNPGLATVRHPCLGYDSDGVCTSGFFANPTDDEMTVLSGRLGLSSANAEAEGRAKYSCMLETLAGTSGGASSSCLTGAPLAPLLGPAPRTALQWTGFGRLDWQAAERHRFTLESIGADWNAPGGGLTRVSESYGNHSFGSSQASQEWFLGRWEAFVTPNLLAVSQVSFGHAIQSARPTPPSDFEKTFLAGNAWGQLPQIVVDNRYGFTIGNPSRFGAGSYPDERLYQGQESLDWVRGKLLVKAGFDLSHNFDATSMLRNQTGTYTYSNVENFVTDALAFKSFGISGELDPILQHTCDQTGKVWTDSAGNPRGQGNLPCYSYYTQTIGPAAWHLSTNQWAGYAATQWQAGKLLVVSAGLRWEFEQLPPPIAALQNPVDLPTPKLPGLGNNWGPRVSVALGSGESHAPVMRLGYGIYFGRTDNAAIETALTQTGSLNGDVSIFMRPTDDLPNYGGGAPPFPYVLQGTPGSMVKPGAVEFAPDLHNPEVHQGIASLEERLPGRVEITASAMASLGRRLPVSVDTNLAAPLQSITYNVCDQTASGPNNTSCGHTGLGPIKASQITVPNFYALWPPMNSATGLAGRINSGYQQITQIMSRANSTYEAAMLRVERSGRRGLSVNAHYTYAHAMDWNPNESSQVAGNDVFDPRDYGLEYGTSDLDMRHSAGITGIFETPWKLHGPAGRLANGWMASGVGQFRSGLPYTMRTTGSLPEEFSATGTAIVGLGPGMNGSGGDNRIYGVGSDNRIYNIGRNTYRYPTVWKADLRLAKHFDLGNMRQLELLAESFNLFNHQNVTEVETTGYIIEPGTSEGALPKLTFLTGSKANTTAFGQPLNINATNSYRERQFQFGLRMRF